MSDKRTLPLSMRPAICQNRPLGQIQHDYKPAPIQPLPDRAASRKHIPKPTKENNKPIPPTPNPLAEIISLKGIRKGE